MWQCTCAPNATKTFSPWQFPVPFKLCRRDLWKCLQKCESVAEPIKEPTTMNSGKHGANVAHHPGKQAKQPEDEDSLVGILFKKRKMKRWYAVEPPHPSCSVHGMQGNDALCGQRMVPAPEEAAQDDDFDQDDLDALNEVMLRRYQSREQARNYAHHEKPPTVPALRHHHAHDRSHSKQHQDHCHKHHSHHHHHTRALDSKAFTVSRHNTWLDQHEKRQEQRKYSAEATIVEKDHHRLLAPAPQVHKDPICVASCQARFACGTEHAPTYNGISLVSEDDSKQASSAVTTTALTWLCGGRPCKGPYFSKSRGACFAILAVLMLTHYLS